MGSCAGMWINNPPQCSSVRQRYLPPHKHHPDPHFLLCEVKPMEPPTLPSIPLASPLMGPTLLSHLLPMPKCPINCTLKLPGEHTASMVWLSLLPCWCQEQLGSGRASCWARTGCRALQAPVSQTPSSPSPQHWVLLFFNGLPLEVSTWPGFRAVSRLPGEAECVS